MKEDGYKYELQGNFSSIERQTSPIQTREIAPARAYVLAAHIVTRVLLSTGSDGSAFVSRKNPYTLISTIPAMITA